MNRHATDLRSEHGMTVLEIMIVLAIVGGLFFIARTGFRYVTKADLVEDSTELTALLSRASQLSIETGEMHRVTLDLDAAAENEKSGCKPKDCKPDYYMEVCRGQTAIQRNEAAKIDKSKVEEALDRAKTRLNGVDIDKVIGGDPEEATRRATALAGHHVADRECAPVADAFSGDATGKTFLRLLHVGKVKFKEVWVQHRDDSVTKGQVAIYFWPTGSSEKSVIELTDGTEVFSVLTFGLTGAVELHDGALRDVNDHMMKNVMGDKDAKREDQQ